MHTIYLKVFDYFDNSKPSHLGIYFSLLLHLSILLFALGLPDFFKPREILVPQIIPIEILNVTEVTNLTSKKESLEIDKKDIKKVKQKKFNSSENTEIKKIDLQEKPEKQLTKAENVYQEKNLFKEVTIKKKKINKENLEKILKINDAETLKTKKIKPKLKPKPVENLQPESDLLVESKEKIIIKKNEEKILEKPKPVEKPKPDLTMASIMKDLRNEESANVADNNNDEKDLEAQIEENNDNKNFEISISERDLVLQQLNSCFNPRAGTIIEGEEFLKIKVKIDREAYVRTDTVQIVDTNISENNQYYEAITESAKAIFYNPQCAKLKLPLNKYEEWKNLTIKLDYTWMKN